MKAKIIGDGFVVLKYIESALIQRSNNKFMDHAIVIKFINKTEYVETFSSLELALSTLNKLYDEILMCNE